MQKIALVVEGFNVAEKKYPGVATKIRAQKSCFENAGFQCDLLSVGINQSPLVKLSSRIPFGDDGRDWDAVFNGDYSIYYIRKPYYFSKGFIDYLRKIKLNNRYARIILEIPTFPYDKEMHDFRSLPYLAIDRRNRKLLSKYVDRIADLSGHESIWGVPTLSMINGIDMGCISARAASKDFETINLICVAAFSEWHGVDRLIRGMSQYYSDDTIKSHRDIHLHLLGEGPQLKNLQLLVSSVKLDKRITFYGQCGRNEMDAVYDRCSFAVASLGMHRIGLSVASTLKTREYLAKGIPFVYSGDIDVFLEEPVDFCLKIPDDDSPLDFNQFIAFYDTLVKREEEIALISRIREYAERHVSIERGMANVIDYLKEN